MISMMSSLRRALSALAICALPLSAQATETAVPVGAPAPASPTAVRGNGPNGATLRCRDGSYPAPGAPDAACADKGGVLVRFPTRNVPTPPARQVPPQVRAAQGGAQPAASAVRADSAPAGFSPWRDRESKAAEEARAQRAPEGATLRCVDGTWIVRDTASTRCSAHGGLQLRVNPRPGPRRRGD